MKKSGRKKPYTNEEIVKKPCFRCGKPSIHQWQICSDNRIFRPICFDCDMELNKLVLDFMGFPDKEAMFSTYYMEQLLLYRDIVGKFPEGHESFVVEYNLEYVYLEEWSRFKNVT